MSTLDNEFMATAIAAAKAGYAEGGIPIGAALVRISPPPLCPSNVPQVVDGRVLSTGYNRRVQNNSAIHHGETNALENAGRQPASVYAKATMYTTLSPCHMCTGAILLYKIPRVVIGENKTFMGAEDLLRANGVEVFVMNNSECVSLMEEFIRTKPELWNEDIGEV